MSATKTEIQFSFNLDIELSKSEIRKLGVSIMRILSYIEKLTGGDPNIQRAIRVMQQAITTAHTLQLAIRAVQLAAGPVGWLYAGVSIVGAGFAGYSMWESVTGV